MNLTTVTSIGRYHFIRVSLSLPRKHDKTRITTSKQRQTSRRNTHNRRVSVTTHFCSFLLSSPFLFCRVGSIGPFFSRLLAFRASTLCFSFPSRMSCRAQTVANDDRFGSYLNFTRASCSFIQVHRAKIVRTMLGTNTRTRPTIIANIGHDGPQ